MSKDTQGGNRSTIHAPRGFPHAEYTRHWHCSEWVGGAGAAVPCPQKKDAAPPSTLTPEQQEDFAKCKLCEVRPGPPA